MSLIVLFVVGVLVGIFAWFAGAALVSRPPEYLTLPNAFEPPDPEIPDPLEEEFRALELAVSINGNPEEWRDHEEARAIYARIYAPRPVPYMAQMGVFGDPEWAFGNRLGTQGSQMDHQRQLAMLGMMQSGVITTDQMRQMQGMQGPLAGLQNIGLAAGLGLLASLGKNYKPPQS